MIKRFLVTLTHEEVQTLRDLLQRGKHSAQKRKRAHALLLAHESNTDRQIVDKTGMSLRAVEYLRQRFVEDGFELALQGKPRGHRPRALQGEDEARPIALACEQTPEGQSRWSLRVLAERWAALEHTDTKTISRETVRRVLKKANSNPGNTRSSSSRRKGRPRL